MIFAEKAAQRFSTLRGISLESYLDILNPISQIQAPIAVDFNAQNNRLLWIDANSNAIISAERDLSNQTDLLKDHALKLIDFAVDQQSGKKTSFISLSIR